MRSVLSLLLCFALTSVCPAAMSAALSGKNVLTGTTVEAIPGKKGMVIVFLSAVCPCSNSHLAVLKKLAKDFEEFSFLGVHSNADESVELAKSYFKEAALPFAVIQDDGNLVKKFRALRTPHAFLLDPDGKILYKGGVTDSSDGPSAERNFLGEALADVKAGREVKVAEARPLGCMITREK